MSETAFAAAIAESPTDLTALEVVGGKLRYVEYADGLVVDRRAAR